MNEERLKMIPNPRLVKLVTLRQTGDPLKGLRELIQNAWDSHDDRIEKGEIPAPVEIVVTEEDNKSVLYFADNGAGWGKSKEEFEAKMMDLGGAWKPVERRGEFGLGRGQVLSMIYDPDTDKLEGEISVTTIINGEPWTIDDFRVEGNDITFSKAKKKGEKTLGEKDHGTQWKIVSNKPNFFDYEKIREYLKNNVKGETPVKLNGYIICFPFEGEKHSIENLADVYFQPDKDRFRVFNQGIYVGEVTIFGEWAGGWGGDINTRYKLDVNIARSEVLFEDDRWKEEVVPKIKEIIKMKIDGEEKFTDSQMAAIRIEMRYDPSLRERWKDKKIFKLSDGKVISLRELVESIKKYGRAFYGDNTDFNSKMNDMGYAILSKEMGLGTIDRILEAMGLPELGDAETAPEFAEARGEGFKEYKRITPQEKFVSKLLEKIIENSGLPPRNVKWGKAPIMEDPVTHKKYGKEAWTDGKTTIWLNREMWKDVIKEIEKGGAFQIKPILKFFPPIVHEMSHDIDTRGIIPHKTPEFFERFEKNLEKISEGATKLFKDGSLYYPPTDSYARLIHEIEVKRKERAKEELEEIL
jgi:hypothetical protein